MQYSYKVDEQLKKELGNRVLAKCDGYVKKRNSRMIWWGLVVIAIIIGYFGEDKVVGKLILMTLLGLIPLVVAFVTTIKQRADGKGVLATWIKETFLLKEDGIYFGYQSKGNAYTKGYALLWIPYKKIEKIIYNEYYEYIRIFGIAKRTAYSDYDKQKIAGVMEDDGIDRHPLYLYYTENTDLLMKIEQLSGIKVEKVNKPEDHATTFYKSIV